MKDYVTTLAIALALALPQVAQAQGVTSPPVADKIAVLPPDEAFLRGRGLGTQNYECQPVDSLGRVGWVLFTPQATLFGDQDEQLMTHYFSPDPHEDGFVRVTWQDSRDTSTVWGRLVASSDDANFVKAGAIPWLKIDVLTTGAQDGPTGGNTLSRTTFIQRLNTDGGAAPATGCNRPTDIGKREFVPVRGRLFLLHEVAKP